MLVSKEKAREALRCLEVPDGHFVGSLFIREFLESCVAELPDETLFTETVEEIDAEMSVHEENQ